MNIVFITTNGYPQHFDANNTKTELLALGLKEQGCNVQIIDTPAGQSNLKNNLYGISSTGIEYTLFTRKNKYTSTFLNLIHTYVLLKKKHSSESPNIVILALSHYPTFPLLAIVSKLAGYQRSTLFHEWHVGLERGKFRKIEAWIRVNTFGYFLETILPISHFLLEKTSKFKKPVFLLPILADYTYETSNLVIRKQFSICISAAYILRNQILVESINLVHKKTKFVKFILILSGTDQEMREVVKLLMSKHVEEVVEIKSQIPKNELYKIYRESLGLLIPLNPNNIQDQARFSQKIAEYIGCMRPIITSSVGEIPYYFRNYENAIIVPYSSQGYYEGMMFLLENNNAANDIGLNGFIVGREYFDKNIVAKKLKNFLMNL